MRSLKFRNKRSHRRKSARRRMRGGVPTTSLCMNCAHNTYVCHDNGDCMCSFCGKYDLPSTGTSPYDGDPGKKNLWAVQQASQQGAERQAELDAPNPYAGIPGSVSLTGLKRWGKHKGNAKYH